MIAHEQIPHSGDGTSFIRLIHHQLMLLPRPSSSSCVLKLIVNVELFPPSSPHHSFHRSWHLYLPLSISTQHNSTLYNYAGRGRGGGRFVEQMANSEFN